MQIRFSKWCWSKIMPTKELSRKNNVMEGCSFRTLWIKETSMQGSGQSDGQEEDDRIRKHWKMPCFLFRDRSYGMILCPVIVNAKGGKPFHKRIMRKDIPCHEKEFLKGGGGHIIHWREQQTDRSMYQNTSAWDSPNESCHETTCDTFGIGTNKLEPWSNLSVQTKSMSHVTRSVEYLEEPQRPDVRRGKGEEIEFSSIFLP